MDTTASFSTDGTYTLRLTADDSALTSFDELVVTVNPQPPVNQAPTVAAGANQTITLPSFANLNGTVTDDGLPTPPGATTTLWTQQSGPGTVTFGSATAVDTTASFSTDGTYTLRLTADDSALTSFDELVVTVNPQGGVTSTEVRVSARSDDAEERATGSVSLGSSDLEFMFDGGADQNATGLRFNGMTVPQGASIVNAYIQFEVDEVNTGVTSLTIQGEATDDALTFSSSGGNISNRARTAALVPWDPAPWTSRGAAGIDQQTPDIRSIVQEIVNRPGWTSGNSMVIIITGTGERTAESFDGVAAAAPLLRVEYSTGSGTNQAPTVAAGLDQTIALPSSATLDATVFDDGLPTPPAAVTTLWTQQSGPGTVTFGDAMAVDTTASFSVDGVYVLRLTADDSEFTTFDELTITVNPAGTLTTTEVRVSAASDDAEERGSGSVSLGSSDLEFMFDGGADQNAVGMRFNGVNVPPGATIANAYVQFQVDEVNTGVTSLAIQGEATDNALTFSSGSGNISSRPRTGALVTWDPVPWTNTGDAGVDQQTPNIRSVLQEIVNRPGWTMGNSLVIIITGTGERTAESFNGVAAAAPLLRIEYQ